MAIKKTREMELEDSNRDFHDHNLTELSTLNRTLETTIKTIEGSGIPYAMIGGLAVKNLGRPRVTHDIDLFVKPDDAETVLKVLSEQGFHIQRRDPLWLYKAWKDEILVDIIFKSSGDIYFDEQVMSNVRRIPYQGFYINAISPEDFIVIKAAAHQEDNPHHWHDALAVLTQGNLDWDYLVKRAKHSPRRVLALLIYGQSNDIAVPTEVIQKIYRMIFEHSTYIPAPVLHPYRSTGQKTEDNHEKDSVIYTKGRIIEALTSDERIAEHDIKVVVTDECIVAKGEVFTEEQREAVDEVIGKICGETDFKNLVSVRTLTTPDSSEAIR